MARIKTFGKEYSYVLDFEKDKPESEQTIWHYKLPALDVQFDEGEEIVFKGDITADKKNDKEDALQNLQTTFRPGSEAKKQAKIIKACLLRIENLNDDDDNPVGWPLNTRAKDNSCEQDKIIAVLPPTWRAELAGVFRQATSVSEEEVKN